MVPPPQEESQYVGAAERHERQFKFRGKSISGKTLQTNLTLGGAQPGQPKYGHGYGIWIWNTHYFL